MSNETPNNIRHYFVVFGVRNADGTVHFETDDDELWSRFGDGVLLDEATGQWFSDEDHNDAAVENNDTVLCEALTDLLGSKEVK